MQIVDLSPEYEHAYLHCLEPYADEIVDGVPRKCAWYEANRDRGLMVKLAIDDDGEAVGMIQAVPIERSMVVGKNTYLILCIWVHGHEGGVGNRQGRGTGTALLQALELAVRATGADGLAAWGMALPFWMKASWFKKHGFHKVDRRGIATLLFKPYTPGAESPRWVRNPVAPEATGERTVTCFDGGWCTLQSANCARARAAAEAEGVRHQQIDTIDPLVARAWRQDYGTWIDDQSVGQGPPMSVEKLRAKIRRKRWWPLF